MKRCRSLTVREISKGSTVCKSWGDIFFPSRINIIYFINQKFIEELIGARRAREGQLDCDSPVSLGNTKILGCSTRNLLPCHEEMQVW